MLLPTFWCFLAHIVLSDKDDCNLEVLDLVEDGMVFIFIFHHSTEVFRIPVSSHDT